jgi:Na+-driven multidrug efflux pump
VLSQLLSAVLVISALLRTRLPCRIVWKRLRFHGGALRKILLLGLPVGVQSSMYPIANMIIQSNINAFGINSIAAWAVCGKLDFLVWLIVDSFGAAISTFVAQNYGARLYARAWGGVRVCAGMSLLLVAVISGALYLWCGPLGRLFVGDADVIELSSGLMRFLAPLYVFYIGGEICSGAICGTGETFKPMMLTLFGTCACRVLWIFFAVPRRPVLTMVIWSYPVSWIVTSCLFIVFYQVHKAKVTPPGAVV